MELFALDKNKSKGIDMSKVSLQQQTQKVSEEAYELYLEESCRRTKILKGQSTFNEDEPGSLERVAGECFDVIQTCVGMLDVLKREGVDIEKANDRHNQKLTSREWSFKGVISCVQHGIIQYQNAKTSPLKPQISGPYIVSGRIKQASTSMEKYLEGKELLLFNGFDKYKLLEIEGEEDGIKNLCKYVCEKEEGLLDEMGYESLEVFIEECELGNDGFAFEKEEIELIEK